MTTDFWSNEPTILFNKDYIFDLLPTSNMSYTQKLNAITRLVIIITVLGYILTMSTRILIVGVVTIGIIFLLFKIRKEKLTKEMIIENFQSNDFNKNNSNENTENKETYINPATLESVLKSEFKEGTKKNPFSNVLLTQINEDPDRKSAPPAFNVDVDEDITKNVKRSIQMMNPGIKNTNKQLFGDLYQQFELDNSNRSFFSTPNTRVENDQSAFAQYLYNDMKFSGKESTPEGAMSRVQRNGRYNLY